VIIANKNWTVIDSPILKQPRKPWWIQCSGAGRARAACVAEKTPVPAFWFRSIYTTFDADPARQAAFSARNMANSPSPGGLTAKHGFEERYGSPGGCHTFAAYARNFPADRPEYLSMNAQGKRIGAKDGSGPGGICLMHPEVRKLVLANLRAYIAKDREDAAKSNRPPPRVYDISQNDNHWMCQCPDCKAVGQREGSESGPVVDFINAVSLDRVIVATPTTRQSGS